MRTISRKSLSARIGRRWPLLIPLLIGALFLALAVAAAAPDIAFRTRAIRTDGRFVGAVARHGGNHGGNFFRPMFSYHANDGSVRSFTARSGSTDQPYADGQVVTILYDPAHPQDARLDTFLDLWTGPLVLGGCGLFLIALGAALWAAVDRHDVAKSQ